MSNEIGLMKRVRTIFQVVCAALALAFVAMLVAPELSRSAAEKPREVELSFMAAGNRSQKDAYLQLCREFEAEHPDIGVRLEWIGVGNYFGMVLTRIAGRVPPDVFWFNDPLVPSYADKNALLDLTAFAERDLAGEMDDFHPLALQPFIYDGGLYGLPLSFGIWVLAYNKAHFDEAGIPYPNDEWTWDTLREVAIQLTRRDERGRVTRFGLAAIPHYEMMDIITGKRFLGTDFKTLHYTDPENIRAASLIHELAVSDRVAPGIGEREEQSTGGLFQSGRASMNFIGRWMIDEFNAVQELDYDVAPIPLWRNGHRGTMTRVVGFCIPRDSKHHEEAWKLVKFLSSKGVSEVMAATDNVPARLSVLRSPAFLHSDARPESIEVFADAVSYARLAQIADPPLPLMLKETSEGILAGLYTVEEAMQKLTRETERFVDRKGARLLRE